MNSNVILVARRVVFNSMSDEAVFFKWLDSLRCVSRYEGKGDSLNIEVNSELVDELALRDLLALFDRYDIDMKQLIAFDRKEFSTWFRNKKSYWFVSVFGAGSKAKKMP